MMSMNIITKEKYGNKNSETMVFVRMWILPNRK